jgi:hypothetical protein
MLKLKDFSSFGAKVISIVISLLAFTTPDIGKTVMDSNSESPFMDSLSKKN